MSQVFGITSPAAHSGMPHRAPARFLVLIDSGGLGVARLLQANHDQVAEFDAGTEEVARMTAGLTPDLGAQDPVWDRALAGHSADERAAARIYTLPV